MANTVYANAVLENKINDFLTTNLDLAQFATHDDSLVEEPGMKKTINQYTASGNVEDLAQGEGNDADNDIAVSFTGKDYVVTVTQGRFPYYDEEAMKDPAAIETGLKKLAGQMTNDLTSKIVGEFDDATLSVTVTNWDFDAVVDAIAKYPYEDEAQLFLLISPKDLAGFRKGLEDSLKYSEDFARTGYIGSVCGVPVYVSKAITEGKAYLADNQAVTIFTKKDAEVEQDRIANTRQNIIYARKAMVVALTDATRVVKITKGNLSV